MDGRKWLEIVLVEPTKLSRHAALDEPLLQ
jgi:hypothetical protein